jgi:5-methylcytosine-specific restriction endonuclease McrA
MAEISIRQAFNRRYQSLIARSIIWNVDNPDKDALYEKVQMSYLNGFTCCYCGRQLKITEPLPSLNVFSLDHYRPFAGGGYNNLSNIVICCHSCNIVKGTLNGDTFIELLSYIPKPFINRLFLEIWRGRIADKIDRDENEKRQLDG